VFRSVSSEISKETYKNAVVEVKVPGQSIREFKAPVIVNSVDDSGVVSGSYIGAGPVEILLAICSLVNVYRSIADPGETILLGDALCGMLEEIAGDIYNKKIPGGGSL